MTDPERLNDRLLNFFIYAPIGLALEAKELLPKLADRGRGQVALTRLAGKVAAQQSQGGLNQVVGEIRQAVLSAMGTADQTPTPPVSRPPVPEEEIELPIDDYQAMTAAEIIDLLAPLSDPDLAMLAEFEQAHRARVTVLNRIRQLQG